MSEYIFQTKSIETIINHFKNHDKVICADEAGLGKTYIAQGVIEELAKKKWEDMGKDLLKSWFKEFGRINTLNGNGVTGDGPKWRRKILEKFDEKYKCEVEDETRNTYVSRICEKLSEKVWIRKIYQSYFMRKEIQVIER